MDVLTIAIIAGVGAGIAYCIYQILQQSGKRRTALPSHETLRDASRVAGVLKDALEQRAVFSAKLDGEGDAYQTRLLEVGADFIRTDALFPDEGNQLVKDSNYVSMGFVVREKGHDLSNIPYGMKAVYQRSETYDRHPSLVFQFPDAIKRDQKRNYHRVEPLVSRPVFLEFVFREEYYKFPVANISGGGVGFYCNQGAPDVSVGEPLDDVKLRFQGFSINDCTLWVHRLVRLPHGVMVEKHIQELYCGAEFIQISARDRDRIVRYVVETERLKLKGGG